MQAISLPNLADCALRVVELGDSDAALVQRFYEANPAYFEAVFGTRAGAEDALAELRDLPPEGWTYSQRWFLGFKAADGELHGVAEVVSDLLADRVWHIGLFIVSTRLHGSGLARSLYQSLENWAQVNGAHWIRLGVVLGNQRAERFWESRGYLQSRLRLGVEMGQRTNVLRVMVKPLRGGTLAEYQQLVPRDDPAQ